MSPNNEDAVAACAVAPAVTAKRRQPDIPEYAVVEPPLYPKVSRLPTVENDAASEAPPPECKS